MSATGVLGLLGGVGGGGGLPGGLGGSGLPTFTTTATAGNIRSGDLVPSNFVEGSRGSGSRGITNNFGDGTHTASVNDINNPKLPPKSQLVITIVLGLVFVLVVVKLLR